MLKSPLRDDDRRDAGPTGLTIRAYRRNARSAIDYRIGVILSERITDARIQ
jgi:hypothetical protein